MHHRLKLLLCVALLILVVVVPASAGVVVLQVEVLPGFAVDVPNRLVFPPVAPGQFSEQNLNVTVWANAPWILMATILDGEDMAGIFEHRSLDGSWTRLGSTTSIVFESSSPTGAEGVEMSIPFRFRVDYGDDPGDYTVEIELTVVPAA
ncbi:MAG: hypothetical protein WAQ17_08190 [Limnochordia bacterium]|jgi:hypothetical protein